MAQVELTKNGKGQQHTDEDSRNVSFFKPALSEINFSCHGPLSVASLYYYKLS